tara:strand:- start:126 stop:290 length:165 start_codon:yes stop_codon:yes gene_type:complete
LVVLSDLEEAGEETRIAPCPCMTMPVIAERTKKIRRLQKEPAGKLATGKLRPGV